MRAPRKAIAAAITASLVLLAGASGAASAAGSSAVSVFAEPQAGAAPVLQLIDRAQKSLDVTMYELTDTQVEQALVAAAKRGVSVRVLLNRKDPFESTSPNAAAYSYLTALGVQVRYAPSYLSLTHQKTVTADGSVSAVLTLNLDAGYSSTRDFGVPDSQPADVQAIVSVFDADWASRRSHPAVGAGDLIWSPGAGDAFLHAIDGAKRTIDLENEEMDYGTATSALCAAARRGVDVKVVMTYSSDWRAAFSKLTGCGAHIRVFHGQAYYIHAKLLLVDGTQAIVGSQNLSAESLWYNRELSVEVTTPSDVNKLATWFSSDYDRGASY